MILKGSIDIIKFLYSEKQKFVLKTLGPGKCFGELALIDNTPRMADA
jgi:CRP-like cAMP-binding protein